MDWCQAEYKCTHFTFSHINTGLHIYTTLTPVYICTVILYKSIGETAELKDVSNCWVQFQLCWTGMETLVKLDTHHSHCTSVGEEVNKRFQFLHLFMVLVLKSQGGSNSYLQVSLYRRWARWEGCGPQVSNWCQSDRIWTKDMGKTPFLSGCPSICPIWGGWKKIHKSKKTWGGGDLQYTTLQLKSEQTSKGLVL